jgi:hypothetical protein
MCDTGHFPTNVPTATTRFGAALAMIHLVLPAFLPADIAHFGADPAQLCGELRIATHERRRLPADRSAVAIQADTFRHHLNVFFRKARGRTMLAFFGTRDTFTDARFILLMCHDATPDSKVKYGDKLRLLVCMHLLYLAEKMRRMD